MSTEQQTYDRPTDTLRDGNLKATIWENHGKNGSYYTTSFARTYEDKNGNLRDTNSFSGTDLLRIAELAREAYTRSNELRREHSQSHDRNASPRSERQEGKGEPAEHDSYNNMDEEGGERRARQDSFRERRNGCSRSNGRTHQSQDQGGRRANIPDHDL